MKLNADLRQKLKHRRKQELGWSQEELAARSGVGQQTISRIESGSSEESRALLDIVLALGLDPASFSLTDPSSPSQTASYVKWFRNSAPYINAHRGKTFVLMFDGEAVAHPNFANIVHDIALLNSLGVKLVLVYGARPQIAKRAKLRGLDNLYENDLRITDSETLECVKDATGALRSHIEALLSMGLANTPMYQSQIRVCSGNFVTAKPIGVRDGIDYEHTGLVRRVDAEGINKQLDDGSIVLLSPIGYSPTGEIFNLTADSIATQTAIRLKADKLIVFSEAQGFYDWQQQLISLASAEDIDELRFMNPPPSDDTLRLINAVVTCVNNGVNRCHCISYINDGALLQELFTRDGGGTLITHNPVEQLRPATIDDVGGILELISPLEAEGVLVKRSREVLETEIDKFFVIQKDGMIVACAALYPYPDDNCGEIACVATHPDYRGENFGETLLSTLQMQAMVKQLDNVFVLTTQTAHWFQEQGFVQADRSHLPKEKQQLYNLQRNSKVFVKRI